MPVSLFWGQRLYMPLLRSQKQPLSAWSPSLPLLEPQGELGSLTKSFSPEHWPSDSQPVRAQQQAGLETTPKAPQKEALLGAEKNLTSLFHRAGKSNTFEDGSTCRFRTEISAFSSAMECQVHPHCYNAKEIKAEGPLFTKFTPWACHWGPGPTTCLHIPRPASFPSLLPPKDVWEAPRATNLVLPMQVSSNRKNTHIQNMKRNQETK